MYMIGFSVHRLILFVHVVDGVQWFRFDSDFIISIVGKKTKNCEHHAGC